MFNLTIRRNAAVDSITVETNTGKQVIDRSSISKSHDGMVRMLVVNSYCEHVGSRPIYQSVID